MGIKFHIYFLCIQNISIIYKYTGLCSETNEIIKMDGEQGSDRYLEEPLCDNESDNEWELELNEYLNQLNEQRRI